MDNAVENPEICSKTIQRAFLAAHLLTGNAWHAEQAVMDAMDSWKPDEETEEALFYRVLQAAVQRQPEYDSHGPGETVPTGPCFPAELRKLLRFPRYLRHCFVLRFLAGLPREMCAQLLHMHVLTVDRYTRAGMKELSQGSLSISATIRRRQYPAEMETDGAVQGARLTYSW